MKSISTTDDYYCKIMIPTATRKPGKPGRVVKGPPGQEKGLVSIKINYQNWEIQEIMKSKGRRAMFGLTLMSDDIALQRICILAFDWSRRTCFMTCLRRQPELLSTRGIKFVLTFYNVFGQILAILQPIQAEKRLEPYLRWNCVYF